MLQILDFLVKHDYFPNPTLVKDLMNELLMNYDHHGFKLKQDTQDRFIALARQIYKNDLKKLDKVAEIAIKYIKTDATQVRLLCDGLETFEALDIVKHETRRLLLGKLKNHIQKDEFKIKDLLHLINLYPNKIRTKAVEQLVELAVSKIIEKHLLPNVDQQV